MRFYGKAESVAARIIRAFESGNLPKALAPIFIQRNGDSPCRKWSWSNQLLTAIAGFDDARGFRQWETVGRSVKKGEKAFHILVPLHCKKQIRDSDTGDESERMILYGFKSAAVFGYEQTEGKPIPGYERSDRFIESLPLVEVANHWELSVKAYNGQGKGYLGYYKHGQGIALGVENLATWAHELVHAADDRLGQLKGDKQKWRKEVVAELGASVLLECLGMPDDSDRGGAYRYIRAYAESEKKNPISACMSVLNRVCEAVALILTTADELAEPNIAKVA